MKEKLSVKTIQEILHNVVNVCDPRLQEFAQDDRKSVQSAVKRTLSKLQKWEAQKQDFIRMTTFESAAYAEGYHYIAGIDEVGRGPLAGPVVTAAVILPKTFTAYGLTDSKKLSQKQKDYFYEQITQEALAFSITFTSVEVIDRINIYEATKQSMMQSLKDLTVQPDYVLIDAMPLAITTPHESIIKGDASSISIAAASVLAKVARDRYMMEQASVYPGYEFDKNAGYGTKKHLEAIETYGITPIHRRSFEPIKSKFSHI